MGNDPHMHGFSPDDFTRGEKLCDRFLRDYGVGLPISISLARRERRGCWAIDRIFPVGDVEPLTHLAVCYEGGGHEEFSYNSERNTWSRSA